MLFSTVMRVCMCLVLLNMQEYVCRIAGESDDCDSLRCSDFPPKKRRNVIIMMSRKNRCECKPSMYHQL